MTYQKAIHELYTNVHTCLGDAPDVVAKDINGNVVDYDKDIVLTKATEIEKYEQNQITNKTNNIASAKTKLEALGLSVDEIKEAFGI